MIYKGENLAFSDYMLNGEPLNPQSLPPASSGDVFISCNFTRSKPYTKLYEGIDDLVFLNCNLNGVDINPKWIVDENCSFVQNEYVLDEDFL